MADYSMYHALGQGEQLDPNDPSRTTQPAAPMFTPPVAPQPQAYQQGQQQPPYLGQQQQFQQFQQQQFQQGLQQQQQQFQQQQQQHGLMPPQAGFGYASSAGVPSAPPSDDGTGLASQMGGLALGADASAATAAHHAARRKKKDRHAYHTVAVPAAPVDFSAAPMAGGGTPGSVAGSVPGQPASTGYAGYAPPGGAQFTAAANQPYMPGVPAPGIAPGMAPPGGITPGGITGVMSGSGGEPAAPGASVSASGQQKVSADDIPSVPSARDAAQQHYLTHVYPTFEHHVPPPAAVSYVALDQGNASPRFARLTLNNIPATAEALATTGLPLGLVLQPLARQQMGELPIPVLDFGEAGPPRCHRCRAYINPFMMFRQGGNKYVCNLCTYPNDTPPEYFCATSPQGVRGDRDQRPELCRGTVEFVVPKEYWTKEPVGLRYLFVIDVTQESYNRGFLEAFCEGILGALYGQGEDDEDAAGGEETVDADGTPLKRSIPAHARVGFVTYDKEVHFYNVSPSLEQAQMMIMPDIEDPFVPLSDGLFVDPYESKAVITSLLTQLPQMFSAIKNPEPALLPTLHAALAALEATGGKVLCAVSALPTWGPGRLFMRDDGKHPNGELDRKLYAAEHPGWRKAAERLTAAGVGVDFFLAAPAGCYLDVGTIGHVAATTGGETFYYGNWVAARDGRKLSLEVRHAVVRETGYQVLVKVRCSNGLQVAAYHGNFVQHALEADVEMGTMDADKALAVTFKHDGRLDAKLDAHFQAALLYTTASGERRVRCSNVVASVSESAGEGLKFVDEDAVVAVLAAEAATRVVAGTGTTPLKDARAWLTERTVDVLAGYRKHHAATGHPPSQLIMPERLKELCMYTLALVKSRAFRGGNEPGDGRVHALRALRSMGAGELSLYLYPRIWALHNLQPEEGFPDDAEGGGGQLRLPPSMRATFARVEPGGVYLVDNGQQCLLWLEKQTSPNLLEDLFGAGYDALGKLDPLAPALPTLPTHLSAQVRNLLAFLRTQRGSKGLTVQLARQGLDGAEYEFARMLVEDRNNEAQSYVDWLVHVHKAVQLEIGGHRKREDYGDGTGALASFAGLRGGYW